MVKNLPAMQEMWFASLGGEDPLEKGMAAHSSILPLEIPGTEEPSGLLSMGLQWVRYDLVTKSPPPPPSVCDWLISFSRMSKVQLCDGTCLNFFLFDAAYYCIVCIYYILLIYLHVDGHLDCFHFFTVVTNAALNIGVQTSVLSLLSLLLDVCPGVELPGRGYQSFF